MPRRDWRPLRPFREFAPMEPHSFDPRESPFIPVGSITDEQVHDVSIRRVALLGAKVYNTGTQAIGSDTDFHDLTWTTASLNQGGIWSSATPKRLTAPYTGPYLVTACAEYAADATAARRLNIQLNAGAGSPANIQTQNVITVGGTFPTQVAITTMVKLMTGDYLIAQAGQNSGGALNVAANEQNSFFGMFFLGAI